MDSVLSMIGLAKKAGYLEIGEDPVGSATRAKKIRLILLANNAASNTEHRSVSFAKEGACLRTVLPCTKEELGGCLGRSSCAMVGLTDIGFANAIAKKLVQLDAKTYADLSHALELKAKRAQERKHAQVKKDRDKKQF